MHIAVGRNSCNGRLVNLLLRRILALLLVHNGIAISKVTTCKINNLLLGNTSKTVVFLYLYLPVASINKCVDKFIGTTFIIIKCVQMVELHIVDDSRQKLVAKLTILQFLNLGKYKVLYIVERLTLVRHAKDNEL